MKQATVIGMSCEHCIKAVTGALEEIGLKDVKVDLASGTAMFAETDITEEKIRAAIEDIGFEPGKTM